MNSYGDLDALLAYKPREQPHQVPSLSLGSSSGSLEKLLQEKVRCLADILTNVQQDIKTRSYLSQFVLATIDKYYCYLKSKLFELYRWPLATSRIVEHRRLGIEKLLEALHKEKRQELVQCWQDIARLRSWLKQYCDLVQRVSVILPEAQQLRNAPGHRLDG